MRGSGQLPGCHLDSQAPALAVNQEACLLPVKRVDCRLHHHLSPADPHTLQWAYHGRGQLGGVAPAQVQV